MESNSFKNALRKILSISVALLITLGMAPFLTSADIISENNSESSSESQITGEDAPDNYLYARVAPRASANALINPTEITLTSNYRLNLGSSRNDSNEASAITYELYRKDPSYGYISVSISHSFDDLSVQEVIPNRKLTIPTSDGDYKIVVTETVNSVPYSSEVLFTIQNQSVVTRNPNPKIQIAPSDINPTSITLISEFANEANTGSLVEFTMTNSGNSILSFGAFPLNSSVYSISSGALSSLAPGTYLVTLKETIDGKTAQVSQSFTIGTSSTRKPNPQIEITPTDINPTFIRLTSQFPNNSPTDSLVELIATDSLGNIVPTLGAFPPNSKIHNISSNTLASLAPGTYRLTLKETVDGDLLQVSQDFTISAAPKRTPEPKINIIPTTINPTSIELLSKYSSNDSLVEFSITNVNTPSIVILGPSFPSNSTSHTIDISSLNLAGGTYNVILKETTDGVLVENIKTFTIVPKRLPNPNINFDKPSRIDPNKIILSSGHNFNNLTDSDISFVIRNSNGISVFSGSFMPNKNTHEIDLVSLNLSPDVYNVELIESIDGTTKNVNDYFSINMLGVRLPAPTAVADSIDPSYINFTSAYPHIPSNDSFVQWTIKDVNGFTVKSGVFFMNEKTHKVNVTILDLAPGNYTAEITETIDGRTAYASTDFKISTPKRIPDPTVEAVDNLNNPIYENPAKINLKSKYPQGSADSNVNWTILNASNQEVSKGRFDDGKNMLQPPMPKNIGKYTVQITETIDGATDTKSSEFVISKIAPGPTASVDRSPNPSTITLTSKYPHDPHIYSSVNWSITNSTGSIVSYGTFELGKTSHYPQIPYTSGTYTVTVVETIQGLSEQASATFSVTDIYPDAAISSSLTTNPNTITATSRYPHNPGVSSTVTWQVLDRYNRVVTQGTFEPNKTSHNIPIPTRNGDYRVVVSENIAGKTDTAEFSFSITNGRNNYWNGYDNDYTPSRNNYADKDSNFKISTSNTRLPTSGGSNLNITTAPSNINHNPATGG